MQAGVYVCTAHDMGRAQTHVHTVFMQLILHAVSSCDRWSISLAAVKLRSLDDILCEDTLCEGRTGNIAGS